MLLYFILMLLLNCVLDKKAHVELMRRTPELLKFLSNENRLDIGLVQAIWERLQSTRDFEIKTALLSVFDEVVPCLSLDQLDFLFAEIEKIPLESFGSEELSLVNAFSKAIKYSSGPALRAVEFLWSLVQDENAAKV